MRLRFQKKRRVGDYAKAKSESKWSRIQNISRSRVCFAIIKLSFCINFPSLRTLSRGFQKATKMHPKVFKTPPRHVQMHPKLQLPRSTNHFHTLKFELRSPSKTIFMSMIVIIGNPVHIPTGDGGPAGRAAGGPAGRPAGGPGPAGSTVRNG